MLINNNNNKAAAGKKKRGKRLEKKICVYVVGTTLAEMVYAEKYVQKQRFTRAYVDTVKTKRVRTALKRKPSRANQHKKKTCREKKSKERRKWTGECLKATKRKSPRDEAAPFLVVVVVAVLGEESS